MIFEEEEREEMVAAQKALVVVTEEEARRLNNPPLLDWREKLIMVLNKVSEPLKIAVSPATVTLAVVLLLQTIAVVWWAQGVSKDLQSDRETIQKLDGELGKQGMLINDWREKVIKMQAILDSMERERQLQQLLNERKK